MLLSMWIINDFLSDLSPKANIINGDLELTSARILTSSNLGHSSYVYLARAKDFIGFEKDNVICVHGRDTILLETEDIDMAFNRVLECFDYYNLWEERCLAQIEQGCSLDDLLAALPTCFADDVFVAGRNGYILSWRRSANNRPLDEDGQRNRDFWTQLFADRILPVKNRVYLRHYTRQHFIRGVNEVVPGEDLLPALLRPLFLGDLLWGALIEANIFTSASPAKRQQLEMLGTLLERHLQLGNWESEGSDSLANLFQTVFMDRSMSVLPALQEQLEHMLWQPDDPKWLYCVVSIDGDRSLLSFLCFHLNKMNGCLAFLVDDAAIVLRNESLAPNLEFDSVFRGLLSDANSVAGTGRRFCKVAETIGQYDLAQMALSYGAKYPGQVHCIDDSILDYLRDTLRDNCKVDYRHPAVAVLDAYDAKKGTELKRTMHAFLLSGRNFAQTGKRMFLHRNTVQYRVEKACEICGLDLEDDQSNLHLLITFWLDMQRNADIWDSPDADRDAIGAIGSMAETAG